MIDALLIILLLILVFSFGIFIGATYKSRKLEKEKMEFKNDITA